MRLLVLCAGGNTRSVAVARILRMEYYHDAVSAGIIGGNGNALINLLCQWCDQIVVVDDIVERCVESQFKDKIVQLDIGPDCYKNPVHPKLMRLCREKIEKKFGKPLRAFRAEPEWPSTES